MANQEVQRILIKYEADIKELRKDLDQTKKQLKGVEKEASTSGKAIANSFKAVGVAIAAAFSVAVIKQFASESLKLADIQRKAEAQLLTSLKGRKDAQRELIKQAAELQKVTTFGDEATIQAQSRIAAFVQEVDAIKELTRVSQDFAAAKGIDLAGAADLITKTFASSTNALSRYGLQVDGAAGSSERLESLVKALDSAFKGQAQTLAQTGLGPLEQYRNALGDLQERIGGALIPLVGRFAQGALGLLDTINELTGGTASYANELENERRNLDLLVRQIVLVNDDEQKRLDLIGELNREFPTFLGNLKTEEVTNAQLLDRLKEVNDEYVKRIALQSKQEQVEAAQQKAAEALIKLDERREEVLRNLQSAQERFNLEIDKTAPLSEQVASALDQLEDKGNGLGRALNPARDALVQLRNSFTSSEVVQGQFNRALAGSEDALREVQELADRLGISIEDLTEDLNGGGGGGGGAVGAVSSLAEELEMLAEIVAFNELFDAPAEFAQTIQIEALRARDAIADLDQAIVDNGRARNAQLDEDIAAYQAFAAEASATNAQLSLDTASAVGTIFGALVETAGASGELAKAFLVFERLIAIAQIAINLQQEISGLAANPSLLLLPPGAREGVLATQIAAAKTRAGVAASTILATTIPELAFAKGTSDAPGGMALVGEEGPEIMHVPKGARIFTADASKREKSLIDAINEGRVSAFIEDTYVKPALSTFADNLAKSAPWQAYDDFYLRQAVKANKTVELGPRTRKLLDQNRQIRFH